MSCVTVQGVHLSEGNLFFLGISGSRLYPKSWILGWLMSSLQQILYQDGK